MSHDHKGEAQAIHEFTKEHLKAAILDLPGPDGERIKVYADNTGSLYSLKELIDEYRTAPERIAGVARIDTLDGFIGHAKRFAVEDSAIFADRNPASPSLLAVYDYHGPALEEGKMAGAPRFCTHRAKYGFPLADEWAAWLGANDKAMSQADFARFLEDRIADVVDASSPTPEMRAIHDKLLCKFVGPTGLLELARGLSVRVESIVANKQDLASGESVVRFETHHQNEQGAPLTVPGAFMIAIPVFRGDVRYAIAARLRYRVKDGKITWWYSLYRQVETFDHAFSSACERVAKETELPLFHGHPET